MDNLDAMRQAFKASGVTMIFDDAEKAAGIGVSDAG
jgi:hypothetical protein